MSAHSPEDLRRIYGARFSSNLEYRKEVWSVLVGDWFGKFVKPADAVLDLGCGYGEFINNVSCGQKFAMDLNPDAPQFLSRDVQFLRQDCAARWELPAVQGPTATPRWWIGTAIRFPDFTQRATRWRRCWAKSTAAQAGRSVRA